MILAMFNEEAKLAAALERFRSAQIGPVETYTPAPMQGGSEASPIPLVILAAGLLGAACSFALQTYSAVWSYPFASGGRPDFAWASFVPTVFENAVLVAIVAGLVAFMVVNGLPRLYDPVDEFDILREASRDGWFLQIASEEPSTLARARSLLRELRPTRVEERRA